MLKMTMPCEEFELTPTNGRKSFYNKANVIVDKNGNQFLKSYNTIVAAKSKSGKIYRLWDGFTKTTSIHINSFCGLSKKEFEKLPLTILK